ncbi:hypothetical protein COPR103792_08415 [Corynebacterium propinquum]|jgi:hypothetical protein
MDQGTTNTAVSIRERMNSFKLGMNNCSLGQSSKCGTIKVPAEIGH